MHLLMYFTHWLNLHVKSDPPFPCLTQAHARWIFVLLAKVEEFVSADDMNIMRNLVRAVLSLLKNRIRDPLTEESDLMSDTSCWLIVSVVVGVMAQRDLWMDAEEMLKIDA